MTTYGPWHPTPGWLRWIGKPQWRRAVYASWMIGGGWDGWDYSDIAERDLTKEASNG